MKKGVVIAGFAGIGKTTLAKKYANIIDVESSPYKYDYAGIDKSQYEKVKGSKERKPNKDYPQNYINAIIDAQTKYDIVLVWLHPEILEEYDKYGIEYILCYPSIEAFTSYRNNLLKRGNGVEFVDKLLNIYPTRYHQFKASAHNQIELKPGEMLEDRLINLGYKLIENYGK